LGPKVNEKLHFMHGIKSLICKVFQSLYFDNFKEWFFSKVTRNFLIETYSFFEKNPTTILLIKSNEKLHFMHGIKSLIELYKLWTLAVHFWIRYWKKNLWNLMKNLWINAKILWKLIPFFQQKLSQAFPLLIYNVHKLWSKKIMKKMFI
jgi:hypothetical protein